MFKLAKLLTARRPLEHYWADTEVAPPDTVILMDDEERVAAAEAEWQIDIDVPVGGSHGT